MHVKQFRTEIVAPVLHALGMHSDAAEKLIMGTALHESGGLTYVRQYPTGPARGFLQMEPATLDDLYNWFKGRADKESLLESFRPPILKRESALVMCPAYAVAAARMQYWRRPEPIPDTLQGQAEYWKKWWNTELGAGHPDQYIHAMEQYYE